MFTTTLTKHRRRVAALVAPVLIAVGMLGGASPAGASITLGPTGGGNMAGSVGCDAYHHNMGIVYGAGPEYQLDTSQPIIITSKAIPEWVEVYAYVKFSSSSSWGSPVAHGLACVDHYMAVVSTTLNGYAGRYYDIGFYARAAYPGGRWSPWIWDRPTLQESYSGSIFAGSSYCMT